MEVSGGAVISVLLIIQRDGGATWPIHQTDPL